MRKAYEPTRSSLVLTLSTYVPSVGSIKDIELAVRFLNTNWPSGPASVNWSDAVEALISWFHLASAYPFSTSLGIFPNTPGG
jgi:hypothetical protein